MPTAPNAFCAGPSAADTSQPPTIAITISEVISFALSGNFAMASPMHIPKLLAVMSATIA